MLMKQLLEDAVNDATPVVIKGFGQMTAGQAKKKIHDRLQQAMTMASNPNNPKAWNNIESMLYGDGVMKALLDAVIAAAQQPPQQ